MQLDLGRLYVLVISIVCLLAGVAIGTGLSQSHTITVTTQTYSPSTSNSYPLGHQSNVTASGVQCNGQSVLVAHPEVYQCITLLDNNSVVITNFWASYDGHANITINANTSIFVEVDNRQNFTGTHIVAWSGLIFANPTTCPQCEPAISLTMVGRANNTSVNLEAVFSP